MTALDFLSRSSCREEQARSARALVEQRGQHQRAQSGRGHSHPAQTGCYFGEIALIRRGKKTWHVARFA